MIFLEDSQSRQIIALGGWFPNFIVDNKLTPKALRIWIHFRGSSIEIFEWNIFNGTLEKTQFLLLKTITTSHYGFCKAVEDWSNSRFILPDYEVFLKILIGKTFNYTLERFYFNPIYWKI